MIKRCVSDIETNGLLKQLNVLYCASARDFTTGRNTRFRSVKALVHHLATYDEVWFHNGISFDYPALCKLYPETPNVLPKSKIKDTLVLSRLAFPTLGQLDSAKYRKYGDSYPLPRNMTGLHGLSAWGYRLGDYKGDFSPADYYNAETDAPHTWETVGYSEAMADYCDQDTAVTLKLLKLLLSREEPVMAIDIEHNIAWLMSQQERNGFHIDMEKAVSMYAEMCVKKDDLIKSLILTFGSWYASKGPKSGLTVPKRTMRFQEKLRPDTTEGAPYTKVALIEFKPSSRKHIARCFKKWYDWEPREFTECGDPKIDGDVLALLKFKEAPLLKEFFDINKIIGMLGDGKNAWLRLEENGVIYGRINPNGAGTGRATHSRPNIAQIPKGKIGTYGHQCRQIFTVPSGWLLLGTDAAGLELRCLGNALAPYDSGAYAELVVNGDIHWHNTVALGLIAKGTVRDKKNSHHEEMRDLSKRWIYAFLYGAGNELLGETAGYTSQERDAWRAKGSHKKVIAQLKHRKERVSPARVCHIIKGEELRKSFIKAIPAIKEFQNECKEAHKFDKGVTGLDGRFIKTRSAHSATNFRLQGDGALVCKLWGVLLEERLVTLGLKHGWDGDYAFCAWVHDEYQIACKTCEIAESVGKAAQETMKEVGSIFKFACALDADFDIGLNWSQTH